MKNHILAAAAIAALSAGAVATPGAANAGNPPDNCGVGSVIPGDVRLTKDLGYNLGQYFKKVENTTPGKAIQNYRREAKAGCQGN